MDPYEILGIPPDADDEAVRKAYLDAVRKYSPDLHPEAFKKISEAYTKLKDEPSRLLYYLSDTDIPGDSPFQAFLISQAAPEKRKPMDYNMLKEYLRKCMTK